MTRHTRAVLIRTVALFAAASPLLSPAFAGDPAWSQRFVENAKLPPMFRQWEMKRPDGSVMIAYLGCFDENPNQRKPLLVYLEGSGAQSHFVAVGDKVGYSLFVVFAKAAAERFHVVAVEKRGVEFLGGAKRPGSAEGASDEYQKHATLEDRVADVRLLLDTLLSSPTVDTGRVVVAGFSEGADVAAAVAAADPRVTHVACIAGAGASQLFDLICLQRRAMLRVGQSHEEVERSIAALEAEYQKIFAEPRSIEKFFMGHAYRRWASFAAHAPVESLKKSRCKAFLAHGTADESVPIESFDLLTVDLFRAGRKDVTIRRYAGRDHSLRDPAAGDNAPPLADVIEALLKWAGE
ncbi:MAG: alpha/beta hydrolase family protein [Phycisphaerae bacterium]